jgi:predicted O-linked N-acetylglucosamine transferase (SPINDLY family)
LFIDTLPYNAHTTASDALWAGLPVLTRMGQSFAGRVAASVLKAVDLPELITTTREQYEAAAIELATTPAKLKTIKDKLEHHRTNSPLFDTSRFTKCIEGAYIRIYECYQAEMPPDHIYVKID